MFNCNTLNVEAEQLTTIHTQLFTWTEGIEGAGPDLTHPGVLCETFYSRTEFCLFSLLHAKRLNHAASIYLNK